MSIYRIAGCSGELGELDRIYIDSFACLRASFHANQPNR